MAATQETRPGLEGSPVQEDKTIYRWEVGANAKELLPEILSDIVQHVEPWFKESQGWKVVGIECRGFGYEVQKNIQSPKDFLTKGPTPASPGEIDISLHLKASNPPGFSPFALKNPVDRIFSDSAKVYSRKGGGMFERKLENISIGRIEPARTAVSQTHHLLYLGYVKVVLGPDPVGHTKATSKHLFVEIEAHNLERYLSSRVRNMKKFIKGNFPNSESTSQ